MSTATCPTCRQIIPARIGSAIANSPESPDDEVALIHRETRRLDQLIAQIKQERAAVLRRLEEEKAVFLRRLNAIRSPIAAIPAEILSYIFEYASPWPGFQEDEYLPFYPNTYIPRFQYFQFRFGKVSSYWRQIAWSTPRLWSCISLDIPARSAEDTEESTEETSASTDEIYAGAETNGSVEEMDASTEETGISIVEADAERDISITALDTRAGKRAMFLRLFIENSKGVPLKVALNFSKSVDPRSPHLVHEIVDHLLIRAFPRIKELHLTNPPNRWLNYTPYLSQLHDFSLRFDPPEPLVADNQVIFPSNAPLRRLSLQRAPWISSANSQPPWAALTLLHLVFIPPDLSVQVFIQCPNLVDFSCHSPSHRQSPSEEVTLTSSVLFPHLTEFHWETDDNPWSRALVRHLHVPALKKMHWTTFNAGSDNSDDVRAFFHRLPPTLKKLTLDATTSNLQYIPADSNIKVLELNMCRTNDLRMLFQTLKPIQLGGRVIKSLPRLKEVLLCGFLLDEITMMHVGVLPSSYSTALVEALEQRLDASSRSFTLELEATEFNWRPEARSKLRRLARKGYKVDIVENTEPEF